MTDYIELHCHSAFSLLDGASSPEDLVLRAHELGYPALALTDHDELGGVVRFAQAADELSLAAIIGAELTVHVNEQFPRTHLVLLAESREGYGNLSTLITRARMDHPRGEPYVSLELLERHARGLYALTGCVRGWVPALVLRGDLDAARAAAGTLAEIFGRRLAIECWDHRLPEERALVRQLIPLARTIGVPWVVAHDVHYARAEGRIVHDVLCAIRNERTLDEMGTRLRPSGEWHLQAPARMRRRWRHAPDGLRATLDIAERCEFRMGDLRPSLPVFPLPPGVTADEYLASLVANGAADRWGHGAASTQTPAHDRQLAHELDMISTLR